VAVSGEARDHVPVHVRHDVPEAGEVDLVGLEALAQRRFDREHDLHEASALGGVQVGHLARVAAEYHPAEAGVVGVADEHDAAERVAPEHVAAVLAAELAVGGAGGRIGHAGDCRASARYCRAMR
jgi:hypothetical protein